jgi:hypothetical protein
MNIFFQGFQLCVLDYEFMILDNAFLIHRPGIKTYAENLQNTQQDKVAAQNNLISGTIMTGEKIKTTKIFVHH